MFSVFRRFRSVSDDEVVPPPTSFADASQSAGRVGSYPSSSQIEFSDATAPQDTLNGRRSSTATQNWTAAGLSWMQEWLDNTVSPQNVDNTDHFAKYDSPLSDELSEASNLHLSPVALVNDESSLDNVSESTPRVVQQCLQAATLADLLLMPSGTITPDIHQPMHIDSTLQSVSRLPGSQLKYVVYCSLFIAEGKFLISFSCQNCIKRTRLLFFFLILVL